MDRLFGIVKIVHIKYDEPEFADCCICCVNPRYVVCLCRGPDVSRYSKSWRPFRDRLLMIAHGHDPEKSCQLYPLVP
jgi:hypothetical protein